MYKSRIKKWGLDKKIKQPEARALLRMKRQRDAIGKDSAFCVRGKTVTIEDVLRYFKRKGVLNPGVEAQPPEVSTPPAIECWTPLPSPAPGFTAIQTPEEEDVQRGADLLEFRGAEMSVASCRSTLGSTQGNDDIQVHLNIDKIRRVLFSSPQVQSFDIPYSPLPPQCLVVSEKLFASIKAYYSGAFDSGIFKTNYKGHLINVNATTGVNDPSEFYGLCYTGAKLMDSKSFVEGRRCFSKASGLVSHLLRRQDPRTLEYILESFMYLRNRGYNEVVTELRSLACSMATVCLAEEHPLREMFSQIGALDDSHFEAAIAEAWRCTYDMFANSLGQFHHATLLCYTGFLNRVHSSNDFPQLLHSLLIQGEQELGKFDARFLDIKFTYGRALYKQGRNAEATAILREVLVQCREVDGLEGIEIYSLEILSRCQYAMGHEYEAESRLQEVIERNEIVYGKYGLYIFHLKTRLEKWLREWGREGESAVLGIDEILGPEDIELEDINFEEL